MFNGVKGADLIRDFGPGGANAWTGWGGDYGTPGANQQTQRSAPTSAPQGSQLNAMLQGDPMARINEALSGLTQRSPNLEALLAQLR